MQQKESVVVACAVYDHVCYPPPLTEPSLARHPRLLRCQPGPSYTYCLFSNNYTNVACAPCTNCSSGFQQVATCKTTANTVCQVFIASVVHVLVCLCASVI